MFEWRTWTLMIHDLWHELVYNSLVFFTARVRKELKWRPQCSISVDCCLYEWRHHDSNVGHRTAGLRQQRGRPEGDCETVRRANVRPRLEDAVNATRRRMSRFESFWKSVLSIFRRQFGTGFVRLPEFDGVNPGRTTGAVATGKDLPSAHGRADPQIPG